MSSNEIEMGEMTSDPGAEGLPEPVPADGTVSSGTRIEAQPAALDPSQSETATRSLGGPFIRLIDPPSVIENTFPVVSLHGENLPGDSFAYTVFPASGMRIGNVVGSGPFVNMQLFVTTPPGIYSIGVRGGNSVALRVLAAGPDLRSVTPSQILAGLATSVVVGGSRLPVSAASYSVVNSAGSPLPGVQISSATGTATQVTLGISVATTVPSGSYSLRVAASTGGDTIPLPIAGIPALTSVQPTPIPLGTTTGVALNGSNLPSDPQSYSVVNAAGSPVPGVTLILIPPVITRLAVIDVTASVPPGTYKVRVKVGPHTSEVPLPIARMPIVITSVLPNQVVKGEPETVTVAGSALPMASSAYSLINSAGQPLPGIAIQVTGGNSTSVVLQVTVPIATIAGAYRLRAQALGFVATAPFTVVRAPFERDPLPDR